VVAALVPINACNLRGMCAGARKTF